MSWDVYAMRFDASINDTSELPDDFEPPSLGSRAEVAAKLRTVFAGAMGSDEWMNYQGEGFSLDISLGDDEEVDSVCFHVFGQNEACVQMIDRALKALDARGLDAGGCNNGIFDAEKSIESFRAFKKYRDQVIAKGRD